MHVALSDYAYVPDYLDGEGAELVVVAVAQGLGRGHDYGFAGMDAERVEVFHIADRNTVVVAVADDFIFDFLPALEALLDEYLRGEGEGFGGEGAELVRVVAEA